MTQLLDLDDDCLLEVLDRLSPKPVFKMLLINKRLNRLAAEKIRVKIKAITINKPTGPFSSCTHLDSISPNQVLILEWLSKKRFANGLHQGPSIDILSVLTKCNSVKSIDFGTVCYFLPDSFLLEVVRRCPDLDCIKLGKSIVREQEWDLVLDLISQKMVHFAIDSSSAPQSQVRLLEMVVAKCPNVKQVVWSKSYDVVDSRDLKAIKQLPKDCRVKHRSLCLSSNTYDDIFDELDVNSFNWSTFGDRVERLSSLKFNQITGLIRGVEFTGLKRLDVSETRSFAGIFINYLIASRFPRLEEFCFNIISWFTQDNFNALFQRITSVKKLSIFCDRSSDEILNLPNSSIHQLKNLETIDFTFLKVPRYWEMATLQKYVDEISSLKKLNIKAKCHLSVVIIKEFKRMKIKQNRVKVNLVGLKSKSFKTQPRYKGQLKWLFNFAKRIRFT